jgi:hypothetical protein
MQTARGESWPHGEAVSPAGRSRFRRRDKGWGCRSPQRSEGAGKHTQRAERVRLKGFRFPPILLVRHEMLQSRSDIVLLITKLETSN